MNHGILPGQTVIGDAVISPQLNLTLSPLHAGTLILDSNLTVNASSYTARAFMQVSAGATDPRQLLVTGPGAVGGLALQPTTFYATAHNSKGDPSVCLSNSLPFLAMKKSLHSERWWTCMHMIKTCIHSTSQNLKSHSHDIIVSYLSVNTLYKCCPCAGN